LTVFLSLPQGEGQDPLADLSGGQVRTYLDGKVEAQRVPPSVPLVEGPDQEDFPAAAADAQGGAWITYVVHKSFGLEALEAYTERPKDFDNLAPKGAATRSACSASPTARSAIPSTSPAKGSTSGVPRWPSMADGAVVVAWSENVQGNWDLYRPDYNPRQKTWVEPKRLTNGKGDRRPCRAGTSAPTVRSGWPGRAGTTARPISSWPRSRTAGTAVRAQRRARERVVAGDRESTGGGRSTSPTIAYAAGNYDVVLRTLGADGKLGPAVAVARTPKYETKPSLARRRDGTGLDRLRGAYPGLGQGVPKTCSKVKARPSTAGASSGFHCVDGGSRARGAPDPVGGAPETVAAAYEPLTSMKRLPED